MSEPSIDEHQVGSARQWWVGYVWTAAAAAGCLAVMVWQVLVAGPFVAWDWPFHQYVDARQPDGLLRGVLDSLANVGGQRLYTVPILLGVGVWVARAQRSWRPLVAIVAGLATVFFVGYAVKLGLGRTSPADGVDVLHGAGQAFPSGHTANATLTWILIVVLIFGAAGARPSPARFRRWLAAAIGVVIVAGMLMAVLDYHWLSDIPGGWLLGLLALMVSLLVLGPGPPVEPATTSRSR
jgi:membrane-associated phospholipid phosphatase